MFDIDHEFPRAVQISDTENTLNSIWYRWDCVRVLDIEIGRFLFR